MPLVGLNCATCHTGTVRESPTSPRQIIPGMPAHQMDLQGYANFLTACAQDPRFEAGTLIEAIRKQDPEFSWFTVAHVSLRRDQARRATAFSNAPSRMRGSTIVRRRDRDGSTRSIPTSGSSISI